VTAETLDAGRCIFHGAQGVGQHAHLRRLVELLSTNPIEMLLRPRREFPPPAMPQQNAL